MTWVYDGVSLGVPPCPTCKQYRGVEGYATNRWLCRECKSTFKAEYLPEESDE